MTKEWTNDRMFKEARMRNIYLACSPRWRKRSRTRDGNAGAVVCGALTGGVVRACPRLG
jgi:hypothetical protein